MVNSIASHKRWLALYVLCLGVLMIVLDTTIVNVALPSIRGDLAFTETSLVWVVNAYMLTFGGFLLLGALGLAVLASLAAARANNLLSSGAQSVVALNGGYHVAFLIGAVFATTAALLGAIFLRPRKPASTSQGEEAGAGMQAAAGQVDASPAANR